MQLRSSPSLQAQSHVRPDTTSLGGFYSVIKPKWICVLAILGAVMPAVSFGQEGAASSDSEAIAAASRAFSAAYVRNDTAALGEVYSDSAVLYPPNRELVDRAAIQRYFA